MAVLTALLAQNVPAGTSYWNFTFGKKYANPPIVIPTANQKRTYIDNAAMVFLHEVTTNRVEFDLNCVDSSHDLSDVCAQDIDVQYIVIPR